MTHFIDKTKATYCGAAHNNHDNYLDIECFRLLSVDSTRNLLDSLCVECALALYDAPEAITEEICIDALI